MGMQRGVPDPYRELGVQRAATEAQIKAAHRKLVKRFHPDAAIGDTLRFLAIQEAYTLLSDPLRRREWDARHAPGPVRAGDPSRRGARPRASDGRWTREEGTPGGSRARGTSGGGGARRPAANHPADGSTTSGARTADPPASHDRRENRADPDWNASGRDPSTRSYRWSAENVPWWEDFTPRGAAGTAPGVNSTAPGKRPASGKRAGTPRQTPGAAGATAGPEAGPDAHAGSASTAQPTPHRPDQGAKPDHGDVYSRSSGAAWSSAARRYFRKGDEDLASRGSFVYRGTQVVTGAKAREASEEFRSGVDPRLDDAPAPATRGAPSMAGAATVGAAASFVVTLPLLILGSLVLNPPLQPTFAVILLLVAALTGALAAAVWVRLRPEGV